VFIVYSQKKITISDLCIISLYRTTVSTKQIEYKHSENPMRIIVKWIYKLQFNQNKALSQDFYTVLNNFPNPMIK
jgi:hypothetical protein